MRSYVGRTSRRSRSRSSHQGSLRPLHRTSHRSDRPGPARFSTDSTCKRRAAARTGSTNPEAHHIPPPSPTLSASRQARKGRQRTFSFPFSCHSFEERLLMTRLSSSFTASLGAVCALFCLLEGSANAWEVDAVYTTDPTINFFPIGSAIRNWGPDRHSVIVVNTLRDDSAGPDDTSTMRVLSYNCTGVNSCMFYDEVDGTGFAGYELRFGERGFPSLGIRKDISSSKIIVHVAVRDKIDEDCDDDGIDYWSADEGTNEVLGMDLREFEIESDPSIYFPSTGLTITGEYDIDVNLPGFGCLNMGTSYTKAKNGEPWSCWDREVMGPSGGIDKRVICGGRPSIVGAWTIDSIIDGEIVLNEGAGLESPWFDFRGSGGIQLVAGHDMIAKSNKTFFPETSGIPHVEFPVEQDDTNWPTIASPASGRIYLAWTDYSTTTTNTKVLFSGCAPNQDCQDFSDWNSEHEDVPVQRYHEVLEIPEGASHPQLAIHGEKQFLLMMKDDPGLGQNYGVYLMERCGDEDWSVPELVHTRDVITNDQQIENGVPNIALNKSNHTVHVVFTEHDDKDNPSFGTVYWARKEYQICP